MKRIAVVGDSWAAGYDDTFARDAGGWAAVLGVPDYLRMAVSGSTARQWASDFGGRLSDACAVQKDCSVVFLGGNDLFRAMDDGKIDPSEVIALFNDVGFVVRRLSEAAPVIVGLYANPYADDPKAAVAVRLLNFCIRGACPAGTRFIECAAFLERGDIGPGIHPTPSGYGKIAGEVQHLAEAL
jgi:lysophospholipase L1-like esterase